MHQLSGALAFSSGTVFHDGIGTPEGVVSAPVGSRYYRTNGQVYRKASGTGNTGWLEVASSGPTDRQTLIYTGSAYPVKSTPYADYQGPVEPSGIVDGDTWFDTFPLLTVLQSDASSPSAANTWGDVAGLSFDVVAGVRYHFKFVIPYTVPATTTGSKWSINGPAFTMLHYVSDYSLTATSRTMNEGMSAYNLPSGNPNASSASTGSNLAVIEGIIQPSASGTIIARVATEVANSLVTAKAGAFVRVARL